MRFHLLIAVAALGCNFSVSDPLGFDIPYAVPEQSVPGNAAANAAGIAIDSPPITFPINVDLATEAQNNHVNAISQVTLTSLSLTITATDEPSGDTDCFDFVESVSLSVASTKSGSALQPQVIATGNNPGCVQTFVLTPSPNVNLKPYIDEGANVTMTGQAIPPADDISFNGAMNLHAQL